MWWRCWQGAWYRPAGHLWIPFVDDEEHHEATRQFVRSVCWYGNFDTEHMERLALEGADGSMEVGPHGFPLSFMNVLAQGHPNAVTLDVVRLIVDLGQSASELDASSGAAPLHCVAQMCGECVETPAIVRFLLDRGASANLWQKYAVKHEPRGGVEGDALAAFNGSEYGEDYLNYQRGDCLVLLHFWEHDPGWAYGIRIAISDAEEGDAEEGDARGWFPASFSAHAISPPRSERLCRF
jgi:hypothetical protein